LSFLKLQVPKSKDPIKKFGIHEAQISFVICGADNTRWVVYAFVDTDSDDEELEDEILSYREFHADPLSDGELDANCPIWDPREYFLRIVEIRMVQVLKEWKYLARTVERSIRKYVICSVSSYE
jgi:hypothetical protein